MMSNSDDSKEDYYDFVILHSQAHVEDEDIVKQLLFRPHQNLNLSNLAQIFMEKG